MTVFGFTLQVASFFQAAGKIVEKHGKLEWSQLKGLLQDRLVEQEVHKQTVSVKGKFLPIDVWQKKGYNTDSILQHAEKQKSDMFGYVYRVPVLQIKHEKITEEIRQRILEAERKVGAKRKQSQQEAEEEDQVDLEVDAKDWDSISSDDDGPKGKSRARGGGGATAKAKSKRNKVPQEKKDEARKANAVILGNARKAIRLLDPVAKEAKKAIKDVNCTEDLKQETEGLLKVLKEANQITKKHSQFTSDGKIMEDMTLTPQQVKELAAMVKSKAEETNNLATGVTTGARLLLSASLADWSGVRAACGSLAGWEELLPSI
eukprot:s2438_g3.t1